MRIDVKVEAAPLILRLKNGERRLAYAAVNAINNTAKRIQAAERKRVEEEFTVRKPQFLLRQAAIIKPFANVKQGRAFAEIYVGQKPRLLLSQFEAGGKREPHKGKRVAVPLTGGPARPSFQSSVLPALTFTKMRLRKQKRGKKSSESQDAIRVGINRTFSIKSIGVFQRQGPKEIKLVYSFDEDVQLTPRLGFVDTAEKVAALWFREELEKEAVKAVAHSRGAGL